MGHCDLDVSGEEMNEARTCPGLPECEVENGRCLKHQWYSKVRLSQQAQQFLMKIDLMDISDEVLDDFIFNPARIDNLGRCGIM